MNKLNVFKIGYLPWKKPSNWFSNIRNFFTTLKFAYQRATKGYCEWDAWNEDFIPDVIINIIDKKLNPLKDYPDKTMSIEDWEKELNLIKSKFETTTISIDSHPDVDKAWNDFFNTPEDNPERSKLFDDWIDLYNEKLYDKKINRLDAFAEIIKHWEEVFF